MEGWGGGDYVKCIVGVLQVADEARCIVGV